MADVHVVWGPGADEALARDPRVAQVMERLGVRAEVTMKMLTPVSPVLPVYAEPMPLGRSQGPVYSGSHKGVRRKSGPSRPRRRLPGDLPLQVSGHLRNSIRREWVSSTEIRVGTDVSYAGYVNNGTLPHEIRSTGPWPLRNRASGQIFGPRVNHPGTRPVRFLERTAESLNGVVYRA